MILVLFYMILSHLGTPWWAPALWLRNWSRLNNSRAISFDQQNNSFANWTSTLMCRHTQILTPQARGSEHTHNNSNVPSALKPNGLCMCTGWQINSCSCKEQKRNAWIERKRRARVPTRILTDASVYTDKLERAATCIIH